jgi:hypothetical protein
MFMGQADSTGMPPDQKVNKAKVNKQFLYKHFPCSLSTHKNLLELSEKALAYYYFKNNVYQQNNLA